MIDDLLFVCGDVSDSGGSRHWCLAARQQVAIVQHSAPTWPKGGVEGVEEIHSTWSRETLGESMESG